MHTRNPKQDGSNLFDCKPQSGPCPIGCNQCFYNRPDAFYVPIDEPHMPPVGEVGDGIMRVNSGHDSNCQREKVIAETAIYPRRFFNTSVPKFDFPGPVVFTANPDEEAMPAFPVFDDGVPDNLMYVRFRVSSTNLDKIEIPIATWANTFGVPVILTFMAYYDREPVVPKDVAEAVNAPCYIWKQRHINSYWCATAEFMSYAMLRMKDISGRQVSMCGTLGSNYCRDCRNCETYYQQTVRHMAESMAAPRYM